MSTLTQTPSEAPAEAPPSPGLSLGPQVPGRGYDTLLLALTVVFLIVGLVMVHSASGPTAAEEFGDQFRYVKRQAMAMGVGLVGMVTLALVPYQWLRKYAYHAYGAIVALLLAVLAFPAQGGAQRWISLGPVNFQPSELGKVAVVLAMAQLLATHQGRIDDVKGFLWKAILLPVPALVLLLLEPDMGTTLITAGLAFLCIYLAGLKQSWVAALFGGGLAVGVPVVLAADYRVRRITSFLDPWEDYYGDGHQVIQSMIAFHSGGLTGEGLAESQAKHQFLPEPWTDFVGSVLAEEFGLIGILLLLVGYGLILWRGLRIARNATDLFGVITATALTIAIGGQAFLNLGVAMGIVPPKGLVLPFLSYGSSAVMGHLLSIGVLLNISAHQAPIPRGPTIYRATRRVEGL
ncbi:MAG: putative lipid II flippase FtsW [Myxococcota bacterium]|nr:putative lipid II flippase FtsW [Myxococcota bacterium]